MGHDRLWLSAIVPRVGKRNKWDTEWKTNGKFLFREPFSSSSYSSSSFSLLRRGISYILMMSMNLFVELRGGLRPSGAVDWQRDWPRQTARQIVILPANLTLSFERLRFLGKSHSACCPVSSSQLARAYGWMTEWGKMGSNELVRQWEWEGCGWRSGYGLLHGWLCDWV